MGAQRVLHVIRRWLGPHAHAGQLLHDFNRSLLLIVDPQSLHASIASRMREIYEAQRVVVFQRNTSGKEYQATYSDGLSSEEQQVVSRLQRGHLARWLQVNETCLIIPQAPGVFEYLSPPEQELLQRLDVQICVPLISLNRLNGFVLLSAPPDNSRIRPRQIELLLLLAGQAALALENATLYIAQRERLRRLHRAERLATAGHLAAGVAHEIRNPLTSIRSTMQYIQQAFPEEDDRCELIGGLLAEVDRIDRTVYHLMNLARPRHFQPQQIDLGDLLEQSLVLVTAQARRDDVQIERRFSSQDFSIQADPDQVKEVFINLFLNALQAMPEGGKLDVIAHPWTAPDAPSNGAWVEIRILDTGTGIAPDHLDSVFNPFFTTKQSGTGLGLAICHSIVQLHDGQLELCNNSDRGACAAVRFPLLESSS